ncbi:MAG: hypothetical protein ACODAJ_13290, partial [Planctomycetota bacterium]
MAQRVVLAALAGALAAACPAFAVTVRDRAGDGGAYDVTALTVTVRGGTATFQIAYARDVIGMASGVGGTLSIDADRNPKTGVKGSPGFDRQITFNISKLAPQAQVERLTGPNKGSSVQIGAEHGNGTRLAFTARSVTLVVPLQVLESDGHFNVALFQQGQFGVGQATDRVPDQGVVDSRTGQVAVEQVAGQAAPRTLRAQAKPGKTLLVDSVSTSVNGPNAVFDVRTRANLPAGALDFQSTLMLDLLIDCDRRVETGIEASGIPFLPFGPDRKVRVAFMAAAQPTIELITDVGGTGETHANAGAGVNDASVQCERRRARIVVPLRALGVPNTAFDWMLVARRGVTAEQVDVFLDTSVAFDTGQPRQPLAMPLNARPVTDPRDASVKNMPTAQNPNPTPVPVRTLPNGELRQLRAALTRDYLLAIITYQQPLVGQPEVATNVTVTVPAAGGARRILATLNWHATFGPQCLLVPDERAPAPAPGAMMGVQPKKPPAFVAAHSCLASRERNAFLLLPARVFGIQN